MGDGGICLHRGVRLSSNKTGLAADLSQSAEFIFYFATLTEWALLSVVKKMLQYPVPPEESLPSQMKLEFTSYRHALMRITTRNILT